LANSFWQRDKKDTKEFRRLVLRSFGKGRRENKRYNTLLFSRFGKLENFRKLLQRKKKKKKFKKMFKEIQRL